MSLCLREEVFAIESLVLVVDGLRGICASVLNGLDRNSAVERSGSEKVGVVRVPASLERPVCDNGEFAVAVACLRVPADRAVVLARGKKKVWVLVAPRKR